MNDWSLAAIFIAMILSIAFAASIMETASSNADAAAARAGLQQCPVKEGPSGLLAWQKECR